MTKETRYMTGATAATDYCNRLLQQLQKTRYITKETYYTHVKQEIPKGERFRPMLPEISYVLVYAQNMN
jgi:hypothetical protein